MKLIALSGHSKSGKSLVATIIKMIDTWNKSQFLQINYPDIKQFIITFLNNKSTVATHGTTYVEVAFADCLKYVIALIFNIDEPKLLWDQLFKETPNSLGLTNKEGHVYSYRELLQLIGTEVCRTINPDIWIKALFNTLSDNGKYIISDVRFMNELKYCKENNAITIRINRNVKQLNHQSETELDNCNDFDHIINNNGTIEDLVDKVLQLNII